MLVLLSACSNFVAMVVAVYNLVALFLDQPRTLVGPRI